MVLLLGGNTLRRVGNFQSRGPLHRLASVGFFCFSCVLFVAVVLKAYAAPISFPNPTPNPFYFSEVAPGDATPEVVAPASGPSSTVTGNNNFHYNVWVPNTTITLTRIGSGGADSLTISGVNTSPAAGVNTGLLSGAGSQVLTVGATRDAVADPKPAGTYSGAYVISVKYTNAGSSTAARTRSFRVRVLTSISIAKVADLRFGETYDGDASYTVNPTDVDSGSGTNVRGPASFTISGSGGHTYSITLPASATITTGDGSGATKQIVVDTFTSNPSTTGTLAAGGTQTLAVGGTRAAPITNQVSGAYSGNFTVTVYYY